jgi:hypothetical protein
MCRHKVSLLNYHNMMSNTDDACSLAHAQAYLVIAKVFRRFDFDLYETSQRDVTIVRDCFNGQSYKGSKGVRAHVTRQRI